MDSDWTVACGADDPIVVVPWNNADGSLFFIDLHTNPHAISEIPEARQYPALANALRRWNQPGSSVFTAKCDVWNYPARLFDAEDLPGFAHAQGSYVDLLPSDPAIYSSFEQGHSLIRRYASMARNIELADDTRSEWVFRPARIFSESSTTTRHGYAITLYAWGYGQTPQTASDAWTRALNALIAIVEGSSLAHLPVLRSEG